MLSPCNREMTGLEPQGQATIKYGRMLIDLMMVHYSNSCSSLLEECIIILQMFCAT
jgi:hypothetical protein